LNISAKCHEIDPYNFELYHFKVGAFLDTLYTCHWTSILLITD